MSALLETRILNSSMSRAPDFLRLLMYPVSPKYSYLCNDVMFNGCLLWFEKTSIRPLYIKYRFFDSTPRLKMIEPLAKYSWVKLWATRRSRNFSQFLNSGIFLRNSYLSSTVATVDVDFWSCESKKSSRGRERGITQSLRIRIRIRIEVVIIMIIYILQNVHRYVRRYMYPCATSLNFNEIDVRHSQCARRSRNDAAESVLAEYIPGR